MPANPGTSLTSGQEEGLADKIERQVAVAFEGRGKGRLATRAAAHVGWIVADNLPILLAALRTAAPAPGDGRDAAEAMDGRGLRDGLSPAGRTPAGSEPPAFDPSRTSALTLEVRRGDAGLFYVTSPTHPGLLVAERTWDAAWLAVPGALVDLAIAAHAPSDRSPKGGDAVGGSVHEGGVPEGQAPDPHPAAGEPDSADRAEGGRADG